MCDCEGDCECLSSKCDHDTGVLVCCPEYEEECGGKHSIFLKIVICVLQNVHTCWQSINVKVVLDSLDGKGW